MATALDRLKRVTEQGSANIPPLENGDHLSRAEFERRYEAMPTLKKAELIEGVVYMPSPVRLTHHAQPHADLMTWLGLYRAETPGVIGADNATARLDLDNEPQPDAVLMIAPNRGGQARVSTDDYIEGAPEFIAEIASSSASYDLHVKRDVYRRSGVLEYLVWRVLDQAIDWQVLRGGRYEPLQGDAQGILRSERFAGLWLDASALIKGELGVVIEVLRRGLASAEHAQFKESLQV